MNIALLKYGIPALVVVLLGIALWAQTQRLDSAKAKIVTITEQLSICQNVNTTTVESCKKVSDDAKKAVTTCDKRLALKDETIRKLREINNMGGGSINANNNAPSSGDSVLDALNSMF